MKKLKKILKKMYCKFIIKNPDKALIYDFELRKQEILNSNKEKLIKKMTKKIQKIIFEEDGLLVTEKQAKKTALEIFYTAKELGHIDSLNKVVKE